MFGDLGRAVLEPVTLGPSVRSAPPRGDEFLDLRDGLARIQTLGAGSRAVENRVTTIQPKRILQCVEAVPSGLIAAVRQPTPSLQQCCRPQKALPIPPVARTSGRAAEAQDALVVPIELLAILDRLNPFALGRWRWCFQPRLDGSVLRQHVGEVGHEILDHVEVRKWIDRGATVGLLDKTRTREPVRTVDGHCARPTYPLAAGAAERQRGINLALDPNEGVENHRPAIVQIDLEGVQP